jgi:hypothetical protein
VSAAADARAHVDFDTDAFAHFALERLGVGLAFFDATTGSSHNPGSTAEGGAG